MKPQLLEGLGFSFLFKVGRYWFFYLNQDKEHAMFVSSQDTVNHWFAVFVMATVVGLVVVESSFEWFC